MEGGPGLWRASLLALVVWTAAGYAGEAETADVLVLSGTEAKSAITLRATPEAVIEDRTPGALPPTERGGAASKGQTFGDEITLFLRGTSMARNAAIEVADAVISTVRMQPEPGGVLVTVFVRQPVTYTVTQPSALGEVRVEVEGRTRTLRVTGVTAKGRLQVARPPKQTDPSSREVAVDAETLNYDKDHNVLTARGNVTLTRGDTTLFADEVIYDRVHGTIEAQGHVVLRDPQANVEGDSAHLELEMESGWVETANADLHPSGYNVRCARLDKEGGPNYTVSDGIFTTCACGGLERPSWSIAANRTNIQLGGWAIAHNAVFRVQDTPVLYFPAFPFPAGGDRQSGFLMPRIGYSRRRGFQYEQPYFWAIDKSSDATIAADVETSARIGLVGEYRYELSRATRGAFTLGYFNEHIRGLTRGIIGPSGAPVDVPENRFAIAGHHTQPFIAGSKLYIDMTAISDEAFLKEINTFTAQGQERSLRSSRFTTSRMLALKTWDNGLLSVGNTYWQDLIDPQDVALQRLPRIEFEHRMPFLDEHVVGRVTAEAVDYQRAQGASGLRGDLAPEVLVPLQWGRFLSGSIKGQVRETAYHLTDTEQVALISPAPSPDNRYRAAPELPQLDTNHTRELGEIQARLGTELARVFDFPHLGIAKLKHTIEPEVQYLFVPQVGRRSFDQQLRDCRRNPTTGVLQPGEQPGYTCGNASLLSEEFLFDEVDAINRRNFISYGITSRIMARGATKADSPAAATTAPSPPPLIDPSTLPLGLPLAATPGALGGAPVKKSSESKDAVAVPAREIFRLSILHGYDISRTIDFGHHESDLDVQARFAPVDYAALSYDATVGLKPGEVKGETIGIGLREPWWQPADPTRNYQSASSLSLAYHFVKDDVNAGSPDPIVRQISSGGVDQLDGSLFLRLTDHVGFNFRAVYDLRTTSPGTPDEIGPHFVERDYLFRVISQCNCWVLEFGGVQTFNPNDFHYRVQLTLVGLGSFGKHPLHSNYVGFAPLSTLGFRRNAGGY